MNKKRPTAVLAQCVECRPGILGATGSVPSITSNVSAENLGSGMGSLPLQRWKLEVQDFNLMRGLSQLEVYLDGLH